MSNNEQKCSIYITGGTGFIGRHLINEFKILNFEIISISRDQLHSLESFTFKENSLLIHLAGHVHNFNVKNKKQDDENHFLINKDLTIALAEKFFCESRNGRLIFTSTVHVHGEATGKIFKAHDIPSPKSAYGQSKLEAEAYLEQMTEKKNFIGEVIILRLPMIYGENNKGNILKFINYSKNKRLLPLGAFNNLRSLLYVKNLIYIIIQISKVTLKKRYTLFFATDHKAKSSKQIYEEIYLQLNGSKGTFYFPKSILKVIFYIAGILKKFILYSFPFNYDTYRKLEEPYHFDGETLHDELHLHLPYNFSEAINETIKGYK